VHHLFPPEIMYLYVYCVKYIITLTEEGIIRLFHTLHQFIHTLYDGRFICWAARPAAIKRAVIDRAYSRIPSRITVSRPRIRCGRSYMLRQSGKLSYAQVSGDQTANFNVRKLLYSPVLIDP